MTPALWAGLGILIVIAATIMTFVNDYRYSRNRRRHPLYKDHHKW